MILNCKQKFWILTIQYSFMLRLYMTLSFALVTKGIESFSKILTF